MADSILIIDSDGPFVQSARDAFTAIGIEVHVLDDASIDAVRRLRPTAMVLSVELAKGPVKGFSLCNRIRKDRVLRGIPILMTSAVSTPEALEKHAQTPDRADDYAIKPIDISDLVERVGRLIDAAPPLPEEGSGDLEEAPGNGAPPPIPKGGPPPMPGGPPPMPGPPPLKAASKPVEPARPPAKAAEVPGPPALPRATTGDLPRDVSKSTGDVPPLPKDAPKEGDLFPFTRYEEAFRQATAPEAEPALGRATPDERLNALRQIVKKYQGRERVLRTTWDEVMLRGQDLARQVATLVAGQHANEVRLEEVIRNRDATANRLKTVEGEFRAFQEEITRIFQEKDAEEGSKQEHVARIVEENATLQQQVREAHEALSDDQRRLTILQEEIEALEAEKAEVDAKRTELESSLASATTDLTDTKARLEMVETVARDRGEEIQTLRDQLDQLAFEKSTEHQRLEKEFDAKLDELREAHGGELAALEQNQAIELEAMRANHDEMLASVSADLEAKQAELDDERRIAGEKTRALESRVEELEAELEHTLDRNGEEVRGLKEQIEELSNANEMLHRDVEEMRARESELDRENGELTDQIQDLAKTLDAKRNRISELEAAVAELEEGIDGERASVASKVEALEQEIDAAQTELFERLADLDRFKKSSAHYEARTKDLETSLRLAEKGLAVVKAEADHAKEMFATADAERARLDDQAQSLEDQLARLEDKDRASEKMLEEERARFQRAEDLVKKAKEKLSAHVQEKQRLEQQIAELETELEEIEQRHAALEARAGEGDVRANELEASLEEALAAQAESDAMFESAKNARAELEARIEELESSLSHKEAELSDAYAEATTLKRKLEASSEEARGEIVALTEEVAHAEERLRAKDLEIEALRTSNEDAAADMGALKAETDSLRSAVAAAEQKISASEQDVKALEASEQALMKEVEDKSQKLYEAEAAIDQLSKDLERARAEGKAMAERRRLLEKAAWALELARRSMPESDVEVSVDAPQVFTGEVEPLDLDEAVDPNFVPPTQVRKMARMATSLGQENQNAAPFAALMQEIEATEMPGSEFDEKFASEETNTDNPRAPAKAPAPRPRGRRMLTEDDEPQEPGGVTEIIHLDELE
jgi:chromosome segregation ATPase